VVRRFGAPAVASLRLRFRCEAGAVKKDDDIAVAGVVAGI
jgi:hypothetical protein